MALRDAFPDLDAEVLGRVPDRSGGGAPPLSGRAAVVAALVALLVVVALPFAPFAPASPAAAAVPGSVRELPTGFTPVLVNEKGEVAGYLNGSPRVMAIWKPDGSLTTLVGATNRTPISFNDKGDVLARGSLELEIWNESGSRTVPKPMVDGQERQLYGGFGPDVNGRTVATFGWVNAVRANAVSYLGSASPTLITALSTVARGAGNGLLFGQLDASSVKYAFLDGSSVIPAPGLTGGTFIQDISGAGHAVGSMSGGTFLYKSGSITSLPFYLVNSVSDEGAVAGMMPFNPDVDPTYLQVGFRNPQGKVSYLKDIVGTFIFKSFTNVIDMNDQCQVLGQGVKTEGNQSRYFLADIPNCAGDVFDAELEVTGGGPVVNREFELTLTVRSEASDPATDLTLGAGGVGISAPEGSIEVVSGPTPALPSSIGGIDFTSVTYRVTALKPGPITIDAVVNGKRNGEAIVAQGSLDIDVKTAGIGGEFFRTDNKAPFVKVGEPAPVRLRLANETGEELTGVKLTDVRVVPEDGSTSSAELAQEGPGVRGTLGALRPDSLDFVNWTLDGKKGGGGGVLLQADVTAKDESGDSVDATIETRFNVTEDILKINLDLDPPEFTFTDDEDAPPEDKKVTITETVSFTNNGPIPLKNIRLTDLDVSRVFSGQELYVTFKEGLNPDPIDPEVLVAELAPGATSPEFTAIWEATDDGEVDFTASATSVDTDGKAQNSVLKKRWKAPPTKYLELTTEVINPPGTDLLEAGTSITINGTIKNLSNTASIKVGPLFPYLEGNTGTMTVAYADDDEVAEAPNPRAPVPPGPLELAPSERKNFQVRIVTNYSDPRPDATQQSGGTRAYVRFEPWGLVTELDGTEHLIRTYDENQPGQEPDAEVKATPADLQRIISIDDSVGLPEANKAATTTAFLYGTAQGIVNAAIASIYAIPDLAKMPVSILNAAYQYQAKVWDSFTEEEKAQFADETSYMIVSILQRNVELGTKDAGELYDQVNEYVGQMLTEEQVAWETGDFTSTSETYGKFFGETIGNVAGPVVLNKLATSPKAVAALERAQIAVQARMEPILQRVLGIRNIEGVLPLLRALESGTELNFGEIEALYGISAEEVVEFQRLADKYGFLLTVRSRHASSIQWIKKFGAMLKPEAIKIKSVSELDVKLGYSIDDLGSIVFKKPEVLKLASPGDPPGKLGDDILAFIESKGFQRGTKEYQEAAKRTIARVKEWDKYEKQYKAANEIGHIRTDFNYEGNAITDLRTTSEREKLTGFRLREKTPGSEEYVVELMDPKVGKFKRVTGDVDPIAFTHIDGSPLTEAEHKALLDELAGSTIGAEHGESATFVKGGTEFISGQFKPDEPGIQFGPLSKGPRVVRFDPKRSIWKNPRDYHLHWEGGFVGTGLTPNRAVPGAVDASFGRIPLEAPVRVPSAIPTAIGVATVGRCSINVVNTTPPPPAQGPAAVYEGADGFLTQLGADGTEARSELHDACFTEGDPQTVTIAPVNQLAEPKAPDAAPDPAATLAAVRRRDSRDRVFPAGTATVELSDSEDYTAIGGGGFVAGQVVVLSAGTDRAEEREIAGVSGQTLVFTEPFDRSHQGGDVVVMVEGADGSVVEPPVDPTDPTDPTTPTDPTDPAGPGGTGGGTAPVSPASTTGGSLPRTGGEPLPLLLAGLAAVTAGTAIQRAGRRRRAA